MRNSICISNNNSELIKYSTIYLDIINQYHVIVLTRILLFQSLTINTSTTSGGKKQNTHTQKKKTVLKQSDSMPNGLDNFKIVDTLAMDLYHHDVVWCQR